MKSIFFILTLFFILAFPKCINAGNDLKGNGTETLITSKLELFIKEKKFQADEALLYPGINSKPLKNKLTELINESAKDFLLVANSQPSDENYQNKIKSGLLRFDPYFSELSSEDLDRIYRYYEQLFEIVGLKNTGNHLKKWRYGSGTN
ncbi:MAG: DUF4844 domain-containing protein [Bacteroidia bacterium]|nr:DUF4844 domain-containing protein [Bacteroidia bacterium]